jgi:salicylate hydroxylase
VAPNHIRRCYKDWLTRISDRRVIHRADYQSLLLEEAKKLGVDLLMGAEVSKAELDAEEPSILLKDGRRISGDVIVAADGR